jgi:hypothetical protein
MKAESSLLGDIERMLEQSFSGYKTFELKQGDYRNVFYKNYEKEKLSIVIRPLLKKTDQREAGDLRRKIQVFLKTTRGKERVRLKDTILSDGWQNVLYEKIQALEMLIAEMTICNSCGCIPVPVMCKRSEKGTRFVSTRCAKCNTWINTPFGIGLKTLLHKYLKK